MEIGRNMVKRGIAWILAVVFMFSGITESGIGKMTVQAADSDVAMREEKVSLGYNYSAAIVTNACY